MISNNDNSQYTDVLPFLIEDNSKLFVQKMFETLINIMKTAKITEQCDEVVSIIERNIQFSPKQKDLEEKKGYLRERRNFDKGNSASEESFESESDQSADFSELSKNDISKQNFFQELQKPDIDYKALQVSYMLKKESQIQEKENLLNQLKNLESLKNEELSQFEDERQFPEIISKVLKNPSKNNEIYSSHSNIPEKNIK